MPPIYKLTYFDFRGRVEVARLLLHVAGAPFEDVRLALADIPTLKDKTPFGQLPVLEVDGQPIPQTYAISRYLAKQFGFAGNSPFESAWVDAIADQHTDYYNEILPVLRVYFGFLQGGTDKDQLLKDVAVPAREKYFTILEKIANENGKPGHFVGASLTWVDLLIADHVDIINKFIPGFLDDFPTVLATVKKIEATPRVKEWIEMRPDSLY